jgi:5-methylcytosine-specific restriction endonuclease McrA
MMTKKQLFEVWEKTKGHCHFCGDETNFDKRGWTDGDMAGHWEVDHIIQKGRGGSKTVENCLPACTQCNRLRWHRLGEEVRELLRLGLIARDEIRKATATGERLKLLNANRLAQNKSRRKSTKTTSVEV